MYISRKPGSLRGVVKGLKNIMDRESRKKAAKEAAMEAEKIKVLHGIFLLMQSCISEKLHTCLSCVDRFSKTPQRVL